MSLKNISQKNNLPADVSLMNVFLRFNYAQKTTNSKHLENNTRPCYINTTINRMDERRFFKNV